jgi:undecaprenyl phosphate-alpha-L-ara4N flippase subunit ArnE
MTASQTTTPLSSILLVLLGSLIGSFGAVFLKLGATKLNEGFHQIVNWRLVLGIGLFLGSSVPFLMGIKHGELSVLYPMVSTSYVFAMLWSKLFFGEKVSPAKALSVAVILAGVVCIGIGGH